MIEYLSPTEDNWNITVSEESCTYSSLAATATLFPDGAAQCNFKGYSVCKTIKGEGQARQDEFMLWVRDLVYEYKQRNQPAHIRFTST